MIFDIKEELKKIKLELNVLQRKLNKEGIPVIIMIDGFSAAGTGGVMSQLIFEMDPRHFKVHVFEKETETDLRMPLLWRFWNKFPQKGKISIFDKSYYSHILYDYKADKEYVKDILLTFEELEKMLVDDGFVIMKFFLDISEKEQKKRLKKLKKNKATRFRVSKDDLDQNANFKKVKKHIGKIIDESNFSFSPWRRVDSEDSDKAAYQVLKQVRNTLQSALDRKEKTEKIEIKPYKPKFSLDSIKLYGCVLEEKEYKKRLKALQKEAKKLAYLMYIKRIPTVLVFEGWDAAGKGGAIKRLLKRVDPRGYEVVPIAAPSSYDKNLHYLSRFYRHLPKTGHIALYDRSWYGRVMVERVEGFATEEEWSRAFDEIKSFEKALAHSGALVMKFFVHIDKETQLERFKAREANPLKNYKITDEDWRNREKWDEYRTAISEMIDRTDKKYAPWIIVEGNDKKYARIKVLESFVKGAKKALASNR